MRAIEEIRASLYRQLAPNHNDGRGLSWLNKFILCMIIASVLMVILESEPLIANGREALFNAASLVAGIFFGIEYLLRVWVSVEDPRYFGPIKGRLRYMLSPVAIIDLLAVAPLLLWIVGPQAFMLRLARLLGILRLAKLGRFSTAITAIGEALKSRRFELLASAGCALGLLLITSTLMYLIEGDIQPKVFGSIPRAMWWSVVTLTTVGYGDAFPVTPLGQVLAGLTAILGIGLIAMPTGILAAAFSNALQSRRPKKIADKNRIEKAE